ncbi:MAG TPA: hypothetical protein VL096_14885 [Pirellulaceae bacterium]|nr:hypothetical protein [Pirellulaceae bacterium]
MIRLRMPLWLMICFVACLLSGCGEKGPKLYDISGTASYDGVPIEKGEISFVPADATQSPDGAAIENGKFQLKAQAGPKTVQIRGSRPLPKERQDNPQMGLLYEDYIPAQFNSSSTLKEEVKASGGNNFTFDLKSK